MSPVCWYTSVAFTSCVGFPSCISPSCIYPVCRHTPAACLPHVLVYPNCVPHNPCAVIPRLAVLCIPQLRLAYTKCRPPRACHFEDASMPGDDDPDAEPFVQSIHLLFPWATDVLGILAPNLFLDATFNVTIYGFKVVAITTLDGNRQHRPLQVGSIACPTCSGRVVTVGVIHHEDRWRSVAGRAS